MKHKIYLTDSIEILRNEVLIGSANTFQEAGKIINNYLDANDIHREPYSRYLMGEIATFIDFGSWSKFIAIIPPFAISDLTQDKNS